MGGNGRGSWRVKKDSEYLKKTAFLNRVGFQKRSQLERTARPGRNLSARRRSRSRALSARRLLHFAQMKAAALRDENRCIIRARWTLVRRLPSFFKSSGRQHRAPGKRRHPPTDPSSIRHWPGPRTVEGSHSIFTLKMNLLKGTSPPRPHPSDWMILQFHPWITQEKRLPWEKRRLHILVTAPTPPSATSSRRLRSWPTDP